MNKTFALLGGVSMVVASASPAMAQGPAPEGQIIVVDGTPTAPAAPTPAPQQPQPIVVQPGGGLPSPGEVVAEQPAAGQWVYTAEGGYVWVPAGTTTYTVEGVPYAYLYTPSYGWTWYASPWGVGPYVYGPWVAGPWAYGFRAWAYGPGGWGWRAGSFGRPGYHGAYGVPGHYYGYGGRVVTGGRGWGGGHYGGGHFGGGGHGGGHGR